MTSGDDMSIKELSKKYLNQSIEMRRHLHQYPEVSGQEIQTCAYIQETLTKAGIENKVMGDTGVLGIIHGKGPGKTVLLRADIDALPIQETANVDYKSKNDGVMHACGHDGHAGNLLGAALILNELKDTFDGTIKLMFQPSEEAYPSGAQKMIKEGILDNVDAAFGLHLIGSMPYGTTSYINGPMMASIDDFDITIIGKGAHAAHPQLGIDPIVIASDYISQLQNIVARKVKANEALVLSVTSIQSQTNAYNVIPQEVYLKGTVRNLNPQVRQEVPLLMEKLLKGLSLANDSTYQFNYNFDLPVLVNDKTTNQIAIKAMEEIVGKDNISEMNNPVMGGEDFAFVAEKVPTSYLYLGVKEEGKPEAIHHHPEFQFNDDILEIGSAILAQCALNYLNQ